MGRVQAIRDTPDGDLGLSEISYWLMRRLWFGRKAIKESFGFIPKYELEVMRGMNVMRPICTFHYRDKKAFDLIACAIIADGIHGKAIQELLQSVPGDIRGTWMPSTRSMMEDKPVEISEDEREEFSRRLSEYKFHAD
jgi:hypothetical protein